MIPHDGPLRWEDFDNLRDTCDGQHERQGERTDKLEAAMLSLRGEVGQDYTEIRRDYVTKEMLKAALELIEERYKWFVLIVKLFAVGALAAMGSALWKLLLKP